MGQEQFGKDNLIARLKEMGIWKNVPFLASNFGASAGMTVTVVPANVVVNRYCRVGNLIHWNLWLSGVVLGGVASNQINLIPPTPNKIARYQGTQFGWAYDGAETLCAVSCSPQQPPNFPAAIGVTPFPLRTFTLGGAVQIKFNIKYEYGKSIYMP